MKIRAKQISNGKRGSAKKRSSMKKRKHRMGKEKI